MNTTVLEYRSPDLSQYKLAHEYKIRCLKCGAGENCIAATWQRGRVELKCVCGWGSELFIDTRGKIGKEKKKHARP